MASGTSIRQSRRSERLAPRLAELLISARGERTRADVARDAGVAVSTLAALELGTANPTLAYIEALEELYDCRFTLTVAH